MLGLGVDFFLGDPGFNPGPVPPSQEFEQIVTGVVGGSYSVFGTLEVFASVSGAFDSDRQFARMDASNSSLTFLDVLTPGVSLVSESGYSYQEAAAIPEPGSALLTLCGAIGLGAVRIRKMRRSYSPIPGLSARSVMQ